MFIRYGMLLIAAASLPAQAKPSRTETWGKPQVSFEQYRRDAVECATLGYFRDVSQDEPAKKFIRGFQTYDNGLNMPVWNGAGGPPMAMTSTRDSVLMMNPDQRLKEVQAVQVGDVERCLTERGYAKFTLTDRQDRELKRYPKGSDARRQFLYRLASAAR